MRLAVGCIAIVIGTVGLSPTSQELRNRYGRPETERFTAGPGISLSVEYGSDHQACQMKIEPTQPLIHPIMASDTLMPEAEVTKILGEVVPVGSRGKLIKTGGFQASCGVGNLAEYENVSIVRASTACSHTVSSSEVGTMIVFKRDICGVSKDSSGVVIWH